MAWIEVHDSLKEHEKTWRLAESLNIPQAYAVGLMVCLWTWCLTHAEDGDLSPFPQKAIGEAMGVKKNAYKYIQAMVYAGFLEDTQNKLMICNWERYAGKLIEQREKKRLRNRQNYQIQQSERQPTVPNPTVPNLTFEEDEEECSADMRAFWQEHYGEEPTREIVYRLVVLSRRYDKHLIDRAVYEAHIHQAKQPMAYVTRTLARWAIGGINSHADLIKMEMLLPENLILQL